MLSCRVKLENQLSCNLFLLNCFSGECLGASPGAVAFDGTVLVLFVHLMRTALHCRSLMLEGLDVLLSCSHGAVAVAHVAVRRRWLAFFLVVCQFELFFVL